MSAPGDRSAGEFQRAQQAAGVADRTGKVEAGHRVDLPDLHADMCDDGRCDLAGAHGAWMQVERHAARQDLAHRWARQPDHRARSGLGPIVSRQRGLRIPLTPDPWEALAWAIMGQQISVKMAVLLRRNLITAAGALHPSGLRAHPSAETVAGLGVSDLRSLKFSGSKADYLTGAARAVAEGKLPLHRMHEMPVEEAARLAQAVRGIGPWTVQYFFLRGLGLPDCLPAGDAGLAQGLGRICGERPTESKIREMMARFSPWRSLATYHVWASLTA